MTDIEALRARMREAAEKAKAARQAFQAENAKPDHDPEFPSDAWYEAYLEWGAAVSRLENAVGAEAILALDAEITRLRDDLDRVTRERDEARAELALYQGDPNGITKVPDHIAEHAAALGKSLLEQKARADAAEAALAKRDEEVAVWRAKYREAVDAVNRATDREIAEALNPDTLRYGNKRFKRKEPTNAE